MGDTNYRSRNAYQHISDFAKDPIVVQRKCSISYHSIAVHVGGYPMNVCRIWNRWVQDGKPERLAESLWPPVTSSREDRHVNSRDLMDHANTSRGLSQELGSFSRRQVSTRTVRRRFLQHRLSARSP
ncbi:HTH_Tnp_Tc3_2 domain-containing protein [Trichonephila clavipes]|nr:HTH_Tnp_Tc3_2 domain-containing protein [Trichonephila clavipes]